MAASLGEIAHVYPSAGELENSIMSCTLVLIFVPNLLLPRISFPEMCTYRKRWTLPLELDPGAGRRSEIYLVDLR